MVERGALKDYSILKWRLALN